MRQGGSGHWSLVSGEYFCSFPFLLFISGLTLLSISDGVMPFTLILNKNVCMIPLALKGHNKQHRVQPCAEADIYPIAL